MCFRIKSNRLLGYTVYSIISTIIELCLVTAIIYWGLPYFGIEMPLWGFVIIIGLLLFYSGYSYTMGRKALSRKLIHELESMVGLHATVVSTLNPNGYVRIRGELWKANCAINLETGKQVIVIGIEGYRLLVTPHSINNDSAT